MKKGFTLLELLVVIMIVAVVSISATISFSSVDDDTSKKELTNKYIEIQRATHLYLDLHNSDLEWFIENKTIDVKLSELKNENYITIDLSNPVTKEDISESYFVRLCINKDPVDGHEFVDSSIIDKKLKDDGTGFTYECISNQYGSFGTDCGCM